MAMLVGFAFLAGVVTIVSPCVLPLLPVVLSGSVGGGHARPWGIITGFIASFTFFTLALSSIVRWLGIGADALRWAAAAVILVFGAVMLIPPLKGAFAGLASRLATRVAVSKRSPPPQGAASGTGGGYGAGVLLGLSLGLVWSPCVGPIMASVITLALSQALDFGGVLITVAFAAGTSLPLFLIMKGGRGLLTRLPFLTRHTEGFQRAFGVLMLATSVALIAGWDRRFQTYLLRALPGYGTGITAIERGSVVSEALERRELRPDTLGGRYPQARDGN